MQCVGGCLFEPYEKKMRLSGTWGDTAFLHGLACATGVDVVIISSVWRLLGRELTHERRW